METNINLPGEDYKDLDLPTADPRLCAQACMKEAKCKAWTYVKPGVQADNAKCWLKDKVPTPTPDENCVSGNKTGLITFLVWVNPVLYLQLAIVPVDPRHDVLD